MIHLFTVHYRKLLGTRRTFILEAKICSLVEIFGLYVQVERYLDGWKQVSHLIFHKEGSWSNHELKKRPIRNMRELSALIAKVHWVMTLEAALQAED